MSGLTRDEHVRTALIRIRDAIENLEQALAKSYETPAGYRIHPMPETRVHLKNLRLAERDLSYEWDLFWRVKM